MGGLFAFLLSKNKKAEIFLLDIHPERVEKVRAEGLFIEGVSGDHQIRPEITLDTSDIGRADIHLHITGCHRGNHQLGNAHRKTSHSRCRNRRAA